MKRIRSSEKVALHSDANKYYVSRELVSFNQTIAAYEAIYNEKLFDIIGRDVKIDKEGNTEIQYEEFVVSERHEVVSEFSHGQVDMLFSMIGQDIKSTDNFTDSFDRLQLQALLIDTKSQNEGKGRWGTLDWIPFPEFPIVEEYEEQ